MKRIRLHGLKMNLVKCVFEVSTRNIMGNLVHNKIINVDKNKVRAILEAKPPTTKK